MTDLSEFLTANAVQLNQLLLDPNNPRFSELGDAVTVVSESRFSEEKVQQSAQKKMLNAAFEVIELRDTMLSVGYLSMDRMVVKKLPLTTDDGLPFYYVVEGNRRLAALRSLKELHDEGKITLDEAWFKKFAAIEILELSERAPATALLVLPGLRHVSGIKEWGAYQKAKAVHRLRESGFAPSEAAQSLGLSTRAANMAYRCFLGLEQMKADDEYGEFAQPRMYSYFEELLKRPTVKSWLSWSDENKGFTEKGNLAEFYAWIVPHTEDGEEIAPRLPEAKSIRDLGTILEDPDALMTFRAPGGSLVRALARHESEQQRISWEPQLSAAREALLRLSPNDLRTMTEDQLMLLVNLGNVLQQVNRDRFSLVSAASTV